MTVTVCIGNSDDKLKQADWGNFVNAIGNLIHRYTEATHFSGSSLPFAAWQNACWVFEVQEEYASELKRCLTEIRKRYLQDSVAWIEGETLFI